VILLQFVYKKILKDINKYKIIIIMDRIKELFDQLDTDKDGFINGDSFKRIVNILDIPILGVHKDHYDLEELIEYIRMNYIIVEQNFEVNYIKSVLTDYFNLSEIDIILSELMNEKKEINIEGINNYLGLLI
jgi:hypothetical protein